MSETKHTPGPWHLINAHCVGGPESTTSAGHGIAMCGMRARTPEEIEANTRLISVAPELLEALKALLKKHEPHHNSMEHSAARAIVAKAEGRS